MVMFQYLKRVDGQYPGSKLPDPQGALAATAKGSRRLSASLAQGSSSWIDAKQCGRGVFGAVNSRNYFNEILKNSNSRKFRPAKFLRYTVVITAVFLPGFIFHFGRLNTQSALCKWCHMNSFQPS